MKILITEPDRFLVESKQAPKVGSRYILEDADHGTQAQNKCFHSLISAFWKWMFTTDTFVFEGSGSVYDLSSADWLELKDKLKYKYGAGVSHYQYVNDKYAMVKVKDTEEIPHYVLVDFNLGNKNRIKAILKSWGKYTKKERSNLIDNVKTIIIISGCDDKKVQEILTGMEGEK